MKTSNKLLTLLLAAGLIIPPVMMLSFRSAITAGRFSLKDYTNREDRQLSTLKPFKAVKIEGVADPSLLQCMIEKGNSFGYTYTNYMGDQKGNPDTAKLSYSGDTLLISYSAGPDRIKEFRNNQRWGQNNIIKLVIPQNIAIAADMATVSFNSTYKYSQNDKVDIRLMNGAILNLDGPYPADRSNAAGDWHIQASNASVAIDGLFRINQLNLVLTGLSSFSLSKLVTVDSIRASASDQSVINAPYHISRRFTKGN